VGGGRGAPGAPLAPFERVPLSLRADGLVLDDLVADDHLAVLVHPALPVLLGGHGAAGPVAQVGGGPDAILRGVDALGQRCLAVAPEALVRDGGHIRIGLRDLRDEGVHAHEDAVLVQLVHDGLEPLAAVGIAGLAERVVPRGRAPGAEAHHHLVHAGLSAVVDDLVHLGLAEGQEPVGTSGKLRVLCRRACGVLIGQQAECVGRLPRNRLEPRGRGDDEGNGRSLHRGTRRVLCGGG